MTAAIHGRAYVLGDNVDTDQIIPANYLTYNPAIPEEYRMFGKYALSGVPDAQGGLPKGHVPFHGPDDEFISPYVIIIGGKNFGCGSSREHAPIALAAAGIKAVVAEFMPVSSSATPSTVATSCRSRRPSACATRSAPATISRSSRPPAS